MGSTNFVKSLWLPDIQIYKCKQFKKRQIVTDVAGTFITFCILYEAIIETSWSLKHLHSSQCSVYNTIEMISSC